MQFVIACKSVGNPTDVAPCHTGEAAVSYTHLRFKATYPAERIDSVRSLLEDKERQTFQIVRLMDEQRCV